MQPSQRRAFVEEHFFLQGLPETEIGRLCDHSHSKYFDPQQTVFMKGDETTGMMAVVSGRVNIRSISKDGRELILNTMLPGEVFGEIGVLDGGMRTADAITTETTELLVIERSVFLDVLQRNPEFCLNLLRILCARIRHTSEQAEDLALLDIRTRLAKKLVALAEEGVEADVKSVRSVIHISQKELGYMMGTSRESINKQLRTWEDDGLIVLKRNCVEVINLSSLKAVFTP